jgi:hypothetical protein
VSITLAPGQDEQSLPPHRISGFGRAEYSDRNAAAQSLQCRDGDGELPVGVPRHVLAEESISPALIEDVDGAVEQPAVVELAPPLSGDAVALARVARSDDIHAAAKRSAVEGSSVRPDRRVMKPPRFHRRDQAGGGSSFPLHVTDAAASLSAMMVGELQSKLKPADAGADAEDVEGRYSHVMVEGPLINHHLAPPSAWE